MPAKDSKEIFVRLLSDVRQGSERTTAIFQDLSHVLQDADIKQALDARVFVSQKVLETLDHCFKIIGEPPVKLSGTRAKIYEALAEDSRKEVAEIQDTRARRLFILAKLNNLAHFRAAEYKTLITAADLSGNYGVATLLEGDLPDSEDRNTRGSQGRRLHPSSKRIPQFDQQNQHHHNLQPEGS